MANVFLICGLPGSGKSTLARKLERECPALRLSEDEWMARLYASENGHNHEKRELIKAGQWETAARALRLGVDVALDWGFWSRAERDDYRWRAATLGVRAALRFLDVPRDELWKRIAARNEALPPDTFQIDAAELDHWWSIFEPPSQDELNDDANDSIRSPDG